MIFVNEIARIIHGVSIEYLGIPSLYYGDRFALVWKIPESEISVDQNGVPIISPTPMV